MNRWNVLEILSRGEVSLTLRVEDAYTGRTLIEKRTRLDQPAAIAQARKEADLLLLLDGNHAPHLYDCREEDGWFILQEEDVQGRPPRTRQEKKQTIRQLARHLSHLHQHGFLYLDLKPDHVLLTEKGLVLIDYNGALPTGSTICQFGTRTIMAPELYTDEPKTPMADSYALGCLCRKWNVFTWFSIQSTRKKPTRRPGLETLEKKSPVPILLLILSVFATGFLPQQTWKEQTDIQSVQTAAQAEMMLAADNYSLPDTVRLELVIASRKPETTIQITTSQFHTLAQQEPDLALEVLLYNQTIPLQEAVAYAENAEQAATILEAWLHRDEPLTIPETWKPYEQEGTYKSLLTICKEEKKEGIEHDD